jgi:hypothetical protein
MEYPIFYIHVELYSSKTGVHISAFNKVLLQLKLHRACDFFSVYSTDYLAQPNKKSTAISPQKFRVGYRFGFFGWYLVGISWFLPNPYRKKTWSVHFGIIILVGTHFFLERGVKAPFFRGPAPILKKKGFPAKPLRVPAKFFSAQNTDQNTNQPAPIWCINTNTGKAASIKTVSNSTKIDR